MSDRIFSSDQLPAAAIQILDSRTVLQVVSITDNHDWASARTWELARAAAVGKRRVALIDLSLEHPILDRDASNTADEGIVDAFLYGVSLSHVAKAQDVNGLYYVGVGTRAAEPAEVWGSERWDRLARGFKNEGAILIAFLPAAALSRCTMKSDGILVLAPDGYDPFTDVAPGITRKLRDGTPMVGVVTSQPASRSTEPRMSAPVYPRTSGSTEGRGEPTSPVPAAPRYSAPRPEVPRSAQRTSSPTADLPMIDTTGLDAIPTQEITPADGLVTFPPTKAVDPPPPTPRSPERRPSFEFSDSTPTEPDFVPPTIPRPPPRRDVEAAPGVSARRADPIDPDVAHEELQVEVSRPRTSRPPPRYVGRPIFEPTPRSPVGNRLFWIGGTLAVVAVAAAVYVWYAPATVSDEVPAPVPATDTTVADPLVATPIDVPEPVERAPVPMEAGDSLFYSVQVAALNTAEAALGHGNEFREQGIPTTVVPVRVQGRVWYRVILGAYRTQATADSVLRNLWNDGLVENLQGTILRTPQAFDLGRRDSYEAAQSEAQTLWDRGIPATVLPAPGGGATLSVGAFERPSQAEEAENLLNNSNVNATLGPRMGIIR